MSQSAQDNFSTFLNIFEILRNSWKDSEKIGKCQKVLKTIFKQFFKNFRKFYEVFGNAQETLETIGKFSNVMGSL